MRTFLVLLLLAGAAMEPQRGAAATPDLVQAELAFARLAAESDTSHAFQQFLAADSIVFAPGPVDGLYFWRTQPSDPGLLAWHPTYAFVSASADLGYDFGPFAYGARNAEPEEFGDFLTVWERVKDGAWKVLVDGGTGHAKPSSAPPALTAVPPPAGGAAPRGGRGLAEPIAAAEARLAAASERDGYDVAVAALLHSDARRFRGQHEPLANDAPALPPEETRGTARLTVAGSRTARARDLACAWGELADTGDDRRYAFLHIWRAEGGAWRLAVDRLSRIP